MAIQLAQNLSNGVSANYLKIRNISIDRNSSTILVIVDIYVSQSTRLAGNNPISSMSVQFTNTDFNNLVSNSMSVNMLTSVYQAIMALSTFAGSVAC